jgi:hypothetical protein
MNITIAITTAAVVDKNSELTGINQQEVTALD